MRDEEHNEEPEKGGREAGSARERDIYRERERESERAREQASKRVRERESERETRERRRDAVCVRKCGVQVSESPRTRERKSTDATKKRDYIGGGKEGRRIERERERKERSRKRKVRTAHALVWQQRIGRIASHVPNDLCASARSLS